MSRKVRISTIQPKLTVYRDKPAEAGRRENIERMVALMRQAGERGSDIALLPETFTHAGIPLDAAKLEQHAETLDNEMFRELSGVCAKYNMHAVASVHLKEHGSVYNSSVFLDRAGDIAGVYHKVHPTIPEMAYGVRAGTEFRVFTLDIGTVGAIICHDNSFVESARCTALMGAEIIFWPHFQSGWGEVMWEVQLKSRAIDNGCLFVSSSYSDKSERKHWAPGRFLGRSNIVNDDGIILADAGREEAIATADVDLDDKRRAHSFCYNDIVDYKKAMLDNRKPEAYGMISKRQGEGEGQ
ncbi:carbon-nitrogen hydrolase family protein [Paenibacillus mesophilus]|uniref:carbon-nitrogen hydrolase family protein n=1 Tax=Paenibacillus mesophilus TaxID=2582849 RepID=UPI00110E4C7C|nr:carbon-nitrogen hydrolase family protein [Paenibacillus mesophilus]TMV51490.1 carbon-nitrogen hydrolase family protein [Paenibacillus mesophilus]